MASSLTSTSPSAGLEQLDGEHPGDAEVLRDREGEGLDPALLRAGVESGGGSDHLVADSVLLHGLHDGVGGSLSPGPPCDLGGQLAGEGNELLGEQFAVLA